MFGLFTNVFMMVDLKAIDVFLSGILWDLLLLSQFFLFLKMLTVRNLMHVNTVGNRTTWIIGSSTRICFCHRSGWSCHLISQ